MGRAAIKRKTTVLNGAISILLGLIFGFVLIVLIEESLGVLNYPPLLESWFMWSLSWQESRIPYYQIIILANSAILGLNLGPGLLTILESTTSPLSEPTPREQAGESYEIGLRDSVQVIGDRRSPAAGLEDGA